MKGIYKWILSLCIVTILVCGIFIATDRFSNNLSSIRALMMENSVPYENNLNGINVSARKVKNNAIDTTVETIQNGGYVLLNTKQTDYSRPKDIAIFSIESGDINKRITSIVANVYLNGRALSLGDAISEDVDDADNITQTLSFNITGDANSIKYYNSEEYVTNFEGLYEFYFYLGISTSGQYAQYPATGWYSYSFYVFEENNFNKTEQLPTISNVTTGVDVDGYTASRFYNFQYEDDKLNFPMVSFDPERYQMTIERRYNNVATTYKTVFTYTNEFWQTQSLQTNYGILSFINQANGEFISFKLTRDTGINSTNLFHFDESIYYDDNGALADVNSLTTNYTEPLLFKLGTYTITFKYQAFIVIDGESSGYFAVQESNGNMTYAYEQLNIFGQMAYYADNNGDRSFNDFVNNKTSMQNNYEKNFVTDFEAVNVGEQNVITYLQSQYTDFVSTNQAPVWLEYVGQVDDASKYYFSLNGRTWEENSYSKNTYFSTAGYYIAVIQYKNEFVTGETNYIQVFTFALTNKTPTVDILSMDDEGAYSVSLKSEGFSRTSVKVRVAQPGIFDSVVTASYYRSADFSENTKNYTYFTPEFIDHGVTTNPDEYFEFTEAGKYYVKVNYTNDSYSLYVFTIDKSELSDFVVIRGVSPFNTSSSGLDIQYRMNSNYYTDLLSVNQPFTVYVDEKPSHATITGTFYTYDIVYQENVSQTEIYHNNDGTISFNFVDYVATNASAKQAYSNVRLSSEISELVSGAYVFNTQKLYVFEFTDSAGYTYMHPILLDYSNINIIQTDADDIKQDVDEFNIVSSETHMYWGTHKSIRFPNEYITPTSGMTSVQQAQIARNQETRNQLNTAFPDTFTTISGNYQMLIAIDSVKVESRSLSDVPTTDNYDDITTQLFIYPDTEEYVGEENRFKGEKYYYITLTDASGNITEYQIEMNMDRSRGMMFTTEDIANYQNSDYRLALEKAGSLGQLIFQWQDSEESLYVIDSVSYEFYPLIYDTSLSTYPYDDVPLVSRVIYQKDSTENECTQLEDNIYYSDILNMVPVNVDEWVLNEKTGEYEVQTVTKLISRPGKYVITRTYAGGDEDVYEQTGDSKVKTYTFYSDNNPIIGTPDYTSEDAEKDFGEDIKLYLGAEEVVFDEFYREPILSQYYATYDENGQYQIEYIDVSLITNLLPIKIKVPESKYSFVQGNSAYASTVPDTFDLTVKIRYYNDTEFVEEYVYNTVDSNGWLIIDNLFKEGIYVLTIEDNAVPPNNTISPILGLGDTGKYFAFKIQHTAPIGSIYTSKNYNDAQDTAHMVRSVDDEGNYVYSWVTSDNSVDYDSILIERRQKTASGSYSEFTSDLIEGSDYTIRNTPVGVGGNQSQYSIYLPAYGVVDNSILTYQYQITYSLLGDENETKYSFLTPTMDDLDSYTEMAQSVSSTSRNVIMFAFSDPNDEYYAKIDDSDVIIRRAVKTENGTYSAFVELINGVDYVVEKRWSSQDTLYYTIALEADNEGGVGNEYIYQIYYHYVGDRSYYVVEQGESIKDFYGNTLSLVIDRTPPSYNLRNIATRTVNVTALENNAITEYYKTTYYQAEDGVYYYANTGLFDFAIDTTFEFTRPSVSSTLLSQDHEARSIYFRKYSKYDPDAYKNIAGSLDLSQRAFQSLVPGDPEYYSGTTSRLRFNPEDRVGELPFYENWQEFGYNIGSFYNYLVNDLGITDVNGYYEIVEIDEAGNYTIYTVILNTQNPTITAQISNTTGEQEVVTFGIDNNEVNSIDTLNILSINSVDKWYTITFNSNVYNITPETDVDSIIRTINEFFTSNTFYTLTISNRFGEDVLINIRIGNADVKINIASITQVGSENRYRVLLENDTDIIKLKSLTVYIYENGRFNKLVNEIEEPVDSFGNPLIVEGLSDRVFEFERGIYRFEFEDNFRNGLNAYSVDVNIGLSGNFELTFVNDFVRNGDMRYTSGDVNVSAPTDLFNVEITKDGTRVDLTNYIIDNMLNITLTPAISSSDSDVVSGAKNLYNITVTNIATQEVQTEEFIIYNIFPAVNAVDSLGLSMNSVISTSRDHVSTFTSKDITLEWTIPDNTFGYRVTLFRYNDNSEIPSSTIEVSGNTVTAREEGVYELRFTTLQLNNTRSIYFMIQDSTISMYQVYESLPNGQQNIVLPAEELLDISDYEEEIKRFVGDDRTSLYPYTDGRLMVKNYFSCYNFVVEVEGDKNLRTNFNNLEYEIIYRYDDAEIANDFETQIIVVYGVSPYSYIDVFAITKVPSNSKFLSDLGYNYVTTEGDRDALFDASQFDYLAIYDAPIDLHWKSYYGVTQNKVYLKYYYNNTYIGTTYGEQNGDLSTFTLDLPGEYRFEFYDLAGNKQTFGTANTGYLTILLKSEVLYYINDQTPIYGAVYNDDVVLSIPDRNTYATGTLVVEVLRNGVAYEVPLLNGVYTFTEQGVYVVRIQASVVEGVNTTKQLKEVETTFTIIKADEARFAYEFSNINGYVITKVIKNNVDITESVRGDNSAIYSLLISEDSFGSGRYRIYVQGNPSNPLLSVQNFDFYVWVNSEIPVIASSIDHGATSVDPIIISFNPSAIFEQIGNAKILLDGQELYVIDSSAISETRTLQITNAGDHYITLQTDAGNTVLSFKVIKKDPLNTVSIIIIVVAVVVVIVASIIFFRMRVKMKIK